jgi:hypothetical protein
MPHRLQLLLMRVILLEVRQECTVVPSREAIQVGLEISTQGLITSRRLFQRRRVPVIRE